jgi:FAD synthase
MAHTHDVNIGVSFMEIPVNTTEIQMMAKVMYRENETQIMYTVCIHLLDTNRELIQK